MQPLIELGGSGPLLHFAVANGFPPKVYTPLLRQLTQHYRVISLPPRALWPEAAKTGPPEQLPDWRDWLARDLIEGIRAYDLRDVILVGHSFGGIVSTLATIEEPARIKALVMLDPTILSSDWANGMRMLRETGTVDQLPMAVRALKRQRDFESVDAAYTYFKGRSLFADWDDEAVRLYAEHGTQPHEDGGVTLVWTPEWEAFGFKTIYLDILDDLPKLRGLVPTLIVRGGDSDTFLAASAETVRAILPEAAYAEVAGHSHLFPLSNPDASARVILEFLQRETS